MNTPSRTAPADMARLECVVLMRALKVKSQRTLRPVTLPVALPLCPLRLPRGQRVVEPVHRKGQRREVPCDDVDHRRLFHPVDTLLGVDLRPVIPGQEPIALQPPRGHEQEDAECRLAEAEAL